MNVRLRISVLVALLLVLISITLSQDKQSAPASKSGSDPQTTGKNIGTIISSAFDTAFPIVGKIMDLFKNKATPPAPAPDKNKKAPAPAPTEKMVSESEVQAAVTKAQTDLKVA